MLIPLYTDRRLRQRPVVNLGLLGVTVAMYLAQLAVPAVQAELLLRPYELSPLNLVGSAFLHGGLLHLAGNMLFLYIFGNSVEDRLGHATYLGLYLGGAVAAALLHAVTETSPALGASGAVAAVTGAYLVLFPKSKIVLLILYIVITTFSVPAVWFVGLKVFLDLFNALAPGETGVAHWAHLGGYAYGIALGLVLLRARLIGRENADGLSILARGRDRRRDRFERRKLGQVHESALDVVPKAHEDPRLVRSTDLRAAIGEAFDRGNATEAARLYGELQSVDPRQVLRPEQQMAVAGEFYRTARHKPAAAAFRRYLEHYGGRRDAESAHAELMLGLLLSRYLDDPAAARGHLTRAADGLERAGDADNAAFARAEAGSLAAPA